MTAKVGAAAARPFAVEKGSGTEPLVLLHGFGSWHGVWTELASGLSGRLLAYDLPGHGRSPDLQGGGRARLAAGAILADLTRRGVETAHLCGHSMGGAVAVLMALAAPARVRSLTLVAPGGFGEEINGPLLERYAVARTRDEIARALADMAGPDASIEAADVAALAAVRALPGQSDRLVRIAGEIARGNRQGVIDRTALFALPMPVAVLWGTADPVLPFAQTQNLPSRFVLHRIDGAGHLLIEEAPESILRTLAETAGGDRLDRALSGGTLS